MSDYTPTEQAKVRLDYAQTEMRRADPWAEFEIYAADEGWVPCNQSRNPLASYPLYKYRRRPRVLTLSDGVNKWELPVPMHTHAGVRGVAVEFDDVMHINQWLAALSEAMGAG